MSFVEVEGRWAVEQVLALAPRPTSVAAAEPLAVPARWSALGHDERAVWGRCAGSGAEPYDTVADHVEVAVRCTCASRVVPCKHAIALLLLWCRGHVPVGEPSMSIVSWLASRVRPTDRAIDRASQAPIAAVDIAEPTAPTPDPSSARDQRVANMVAGLAELDRWLVDRVRTGLADPSLTRYSTWDAVAARLVDAQVPGLANRVRRVAGAVGARPRWHDLVLAELGSLHLIATAGRHLHDLPPALADSVAVVAGWQVRQADVLAGVPITDRWIVAGRSDVREDRIEVRRTWLRGRRTGGWAMVLSFAAYRQSLDESLAVGDEVEADVFRYPGALGLRVLVGRRHEAPVAALDVPACSVPGACDAIGSALAAEPWVERLPVTIVAAPARQAGGWAFSDEHGSLPIAENVERAAVDVLLACSVGGLVTTTCEWTPLGLIPLTVHLADRTVDIGPTADPSFVSAA